MFIYLVDVFVPTSMDENVQPYRHICPHPVWTHFPRVRFTCPDSRRSNVRVASKVSHHRRHRLPATPCEQPDGGLLYKLAFGVGVGHGYFPEDIFSASQSGNFCNQFPCQKILNPNKRFFLASVSVKNSGSASLVARAARCAGTSAASAAGKSKSNPQPREMMTARSVTLRDRHRPRCEQDRKAGRPLEIETKQVC